MTLVKTRKGRKTHRPVVQDEMVLDLANGTWTCAEHGTVVTIASGHDCADCLNDRMAGYPDWARSG